MRILFVTPHVGRKDSAYVRTWQMEPLPIATLAALTSKQHEIVYVDERLGESLPEERFDVVAIAVETYTAKRAYEIAAIYEAMGIPVVLGGYHVTLVPEEASQYAHTIVVGFAEDTWPRVLEDLAARQLRRYYRGAKSARYVLPDRSIFRERKYFELSCVETGRGCPLTCSFCSITAATNATYSGRPIDGIVDELRHAKLKNVFFVEDNFVGNIPHAKALMRAIAPLGIRWVGQGTLAMTKDDEMLALMAESGCQGVLIGFESFREDTLLLMDKKINVRYSDYEKMVGKLHRAGIGIYGTFIFGSDTEDEGDVLTTVRRAKEMGIFMAAFNHLVPFPGTEFYRQLLREGRMKDPEWWLSPDFRFGEISFTPKNFTEEALHRLCIEARREFYSVPSIVSRFAGNLKGNATSLRKAAAYAGINYLLRREIDQKDGLPLGNEPTRPKRRYPSWRDSDSQIGRPMIFHSGNLPERR